MRVRWGKRRPEIGIPRRVLVIMTMEFLLTFPSVTCRRRRSAGSSLLDALDIGQRGILPVRAEGGASRQEL